MWGEKTLSSSLIPQSQRVLPILSNFKLFLHMCLCVFAIWAVGKVSSSCVCEMSSLPAAQADEKETKKNPIHELLFGEQVQVFSYRESGDGFLTDDFAGRKHHTNDRCQEIL